MNVKAFIQRHPVGVYFSLAFLLSYGGFIVVDGPKLARGATIRPLDALLLFPVLVVGVGLIGIILTALVDGRAGLRDLFSRMGRWRVNVGWYAALLIPPVLILTVLFSLSALVSPAFAPGFFPLGVVFGLIPGFFEEIGWMGFAFPKMRGNMRNRSVLATGVLLGALWGLWHAPVVDSLGAAAPHGVYWLPFFLSFIALVAAIRVLIVWIYANTQSVLLAQLMHFSSTAWSCSAPRTPPRRRRRCGTRSTPPRSGWSWRSSSPSMARTWYGKERGTASRWLRVREQFQLEWCFRRSRRRA
jgi:membrane protease YdiL (CAAX protease family)